VFPYSTKEDHDPHTSPNMLLVKSISYLLAIFAIISSCIAVAGFDMVSTVVAVRCSLNAQDDSTWHVIARGVV
jgi:hypothetical protein